MKLLCFYHLQGLTMFSLSLSVVMATSFPINNNYNRRVYLYNYLPKVRYVHRIVPSQIRLSRGNHIPEGNFYLNNMNLRRTEKDRITKDNDCEYYAHSYIYVLVSYLKFDVSQFLLLLRFDECKSSKHVTLKKLY